MKTFVVVVAVAALILLGGLAAGFVISTHLENSAIHQANTAVLANRAHGDITRHLICEVVHEMHLPDKGC